MEPDEVITKFKGPGQWRSQAEQLERDEPVEVDEEEETE